MNAEIITIGDELLLGQVIDSNSAWMGLQLADIGVSVTRRTAIGDDKNEIIRAIEEARQRVPLVLLTGGLGPTRDDITKKTLAEYFSSEYRTDQRVLEYLEKLFEKRGRKMLDVNRQQADLPAKCQTLFNEAGTAPGMLFDENGLMLISMPGVPAEMKYIMTNHVLPMLPVRFALPVIHYKTMVTTGIPESLLADKLTSVEDSLPAHIKLAYLPSYNTIRLRLTGKGTDLESLQAEMEPYYQHIKDICGSNLFAEGDITPVQQTAQKLIAESRSISLAESCTGGFITNQLVQVPGISSVLKCGIVSYANEIKIRELGVPEHIFTTVGSVSEECAKAMAEGALKRFGTDLAISTTGIAGPGGATPEKPVGMIYIAVANRHKTIVRKFHLTGNRLQFMERACNAAMDLLREVY